ncbi:MAG: hypothetical protein LQ349_001061 [Xanthoria aureola]|nr:MAG: hypothetical protein LQ349_001061 [Xanthoria aureola]
MDRIASELQHMIFAATDERDTPNLRLTCKALAEVGLQYLFFKIDLDYHPKALDRLEYISQHPARHHVRRLTFWAWYPKEQDKALRPNQQSLCALTNGKSRITTAISQLVNLKHLSFDIGSQSPYGLQDLLPVSAKTTLQSLDLRCDLRKLNVQDKDYNLMAPAVSTLKVFQISVAYTVDNHGVSRVAAYRACVELFERGRLLGLLRLMPCLQVLNLSFGSLQTSFPGVRLKSVVGEIFWSALREVTVERLHSTGEDLLRFFERHAKTLRAVRLIEMWLGQGMWSNVFKEMRNWLKLEECTLRCLRNTSNLMDKWAWYEAKELQDYVLRKDVSFEDAIRACRYD